MSDPLPLGKKMPLAIAKQARHASTVIRNNNILFIALMLTVFGSTLRLLDTQPAFYALADTSATNEVQSPLFADQANLFEGNEASNGPSADVKAVVAEVIDPAIDKDGSIEPLAQKIYKLVGDAPIREMVPFISQRDPKVAAFLVGIAKKESSLGSASPSKDGNTCYNYWGYKGTGGRGTSMGYACFASAEEAVATVGDRIEVLVNKNSSTPAKMVDTWKCGVSCAGDPGAPSWVSTVALYFNQIVDQNS